MIRRPGEWSLLHEPADPVPGDEIEVTRLATTYQLTAAAMESTSSRLRRLSELHGWKGHAASSFTKHGSDLAHDIAKAQTRYEDAGAALMTYAAALTEARDDSWVALTEAVAAEGDRVANQYDGLAGVTAPTAEQIAADQRRRANHDEAVGRIVAARARLDTALALLDTAAQRCARALKAASSHDKDGLWDKVKGALRDFVDWAHLEDVAKWLAYVGIALAALILVVGLIVTAPVWLLTAAVVVAALALAADLLITVSEHEGASWTNVTVDAVALVTAGASRAFAGAAEETASGARATAAVEQSQSVSRLEALQAARTAQVEARITNALKIEDATNPLRVWAAAQQTERAVLAGRAASQTQALAQQERLLAKELQALRGFPEGSARLQTEIRESMNALQNEVRADRAGQLAAVLQAANLSHAGSDHPYTESLDEYLALTEWELTH